MSSSKSIFIFVGKIFRVVPNFQRELIKEKEKVQPVIECWVMRQRKTCSNGNKINYQVFL